jgi:DNA methylase
VTDPTPKPLIIQADARALPLADASVDLIVTSPPYWGLRHYTDGGELYDGQIGSEASPAVYIDNLIACTREWMRVLKPTGSIFVNLGDKYAQRPGQFGSGNKGGSLTGGAAEPKHITARMTRRQRDHGIPPKSLIGLPWRYALRCIDELGLILRAELIWSKLTGLPVTDRVRRSHETWFHFTVEPVYYQSVDEIREPHAAASLARYAQGDPISGCRSPIGRSCPPVGGQRQRRHQRVHGS